MHISDEKPAGGACAFTGEAWPSHSNLLGEKAMPGAVGYITPQRHMNIYSDLSMATFVTVIQRTGNLAPPTLSL